MGFAVADLVSGIEQVLAGRGARWQRLGEPCGGVVLHAEMGGQAVVVEIRPMPAERIQPWTLAPRSLLKIRSAAPDADLADLRREILVAFLRTGG